MRKMMDFPMKLNLNHPAGLCRIISFAAVLALLWVPCGAGAQSYVESRGSASAAALKLVDFAIDSNAKLDEQALAALIDYVLEEKPAKQAELPKIRKASGAYYEYVLKVGFADFLQYSYSRQVPSALTSPASLRYSLWKSATPKAQALPERWSLPANPSEPLVIRGVQRDGITPDLTTEVYYEYDLLRALIVLKYKGHNVLISISKQMDVSDVGKKGFILNDEDWNYHYTSDIGSAKAGLGWVKSYIYDFFAVGVYVETGSSPSVIRSGVFQWIRAGWSGLNFAQSSHVIKGIERHAKNTKAILESPKLPPPGELAEIYRRFSAMPVDELARRYDTLIQARQDLAVVAGRISKKEMRKPDAWADTPRPQMIEALMLEYFKVMLGKSSPLGKKLALSVQ